MKLFLVSLNEGGCISYSVFPSSTWFYFPLHFLPHYIYLLKTLNYCDYSVF